MWDASNDRTEVATTARPAEASAGLSAGSDALRDAYPRGASQPADPGLSAGARLGERYEIIGRLGQGGMGVVYAARNTNVEHIRYAIKTLLPGRPQADADHFLQEARRASKIRSPHVVQILDFGTDTATGLIYMVMEHLGEDLEKYTARSGGTLPPEQAIDFCAQVCEGIAAAHDGNVVHRDIKPLNCLLRVDSGRETVVVTDFGIARDIHGALLTQDVAASAPNSVWTAVGTPGYVAPEIWLRESKADHRVDVYGVGAMLFKLLTGHPPPLAPRLDELRQAGIPEKLVPVLSTALARDPGDRFPSMRALRAALLNLQQLAAIPVPVPVAPPLARPARPLGILASATVLGVVVFALLAARPWRKDEPPPQAEQAVATATNTPEQPKSEMQTLRPDPQLPEPVPPTPPNPESETKQADPNLSEQVEPTKAISPKPRLPAFASAKVKLADDLTRFCNDPNGAQACKGRLKNKLKGVDTELDFALTPGASTVELSSSDRRLEGETEFKRCVKAKLAASKWKPSPTRDGGAVSCPISL